MVPPEVGGGLGCRSGLEREPEDLEPWEKKREELKKTGVKYCLAAYVDIHGIAKAKAVPIDHFTEMMKGSEAVHWRGY